MGDIHADLQKKGCASVICYGRGQATDDSAVYKVCSEGYAKWNALLSRITGFEFGGCFFSTNRLISVIQKERPDVVHLHCINGYFVNIYRLVQWLKKSNIRTVITLHAEFMHTANCAHALDCDKWKTGCGHCRRFRKETKSWFFDQTHVSWMKMKKAFEGFNNITVVSVSPWLMNRAKQSPILFGKNHTVILNGVDCDVFTYRPSSPVRTSLNIGTNKVVFHATPFFSSKPEHAKGGYHVLQLAKRMPDVTFVIAGKYEAGLSVPANVVLLGEVSQKEKLAALYTMADATVIASQRETFSMIVAESLCCGTVVSGFYAGAPEQIAISEYSRFVEYGNVDRLEKELRQLLNVPWDKSAVASAGRAKYAKERMTAEYWDVYTNRG